MAEKKAQLLILCGVNFNSAFHFSQKLNFGLCTKLKSL